MSEFVKFVFHLGLVIGKSSSRLSGCSGKSEGHDVRVFRVPDFGSGPTQRGCRMDAAFENTTKGKHVDGVWWNS